MRKQKGFTLIELLIVVAIIGIIAAIAIPNLLNAINRGRQKRSMADMRSIATAIESYEVDFNYYPKISASGNISTIQTFIEPTYIKRLPLVDGWNQPLQWQGATLGTGYTIYSKGKGGAGTIGVAGMTTDFGAAIVFSNGQFYAWPEGQQTN